MIFAAALLLAALQADPPSAPAAAAEPLPEDSAEVVVRAAPNQDAQIRDFVGALGAAPGEDQLSRFEDAACPAIFGLPDDQRKAVANRIRRIAVTIGLAVGKPGCTPNLLVMVTVDKRALLDALRRDPAYFRQVSSPDMRRMYRDPGPTAAWYGKRMRNADGHDLNGNDTPINRTTRPASRLTPAGRQMIVAAALIVERRALDSLTTIQLADYAAMRTLGQADPARLPAHPPATILTALEAPMGTALPLTLTRWDLGFLRGFYAGNGRLYAPAQRAEIARTLADEIKRPDATDAAKPNR